MGVGYRLTIGILSEVHWRSINTQWLIIPGVTSPGISPELITSADRLAQFADSLRDEPLLAVDTESNSMYAYREQVCLIQISTPRGDTLLDPIALGDLRVLSPVFASPRTEHIFHAAEYDLICLKRDYGFQFASLFDTMVAARILGWKQVGLGSILQDKFGVTMNKKFQRADWGARPLTEEMKRYAQLDTHFLIRLRTLLKEELIRMDRWEIAAEDFRRGVHVNGAEPVSKEDLCWRVNGSRDLSFAEMAVLQELCLYRDRAAERLNRPHFKVMSDSVLVALATRQPASLDDLRGVPGAGTWLLRNHGRGVLEAVRKGQAAKPLRPPRRARHSDEYIARLDAMKNWRKKRAQQMAVESDVILPRDLLEAAVDANPRTAAELASLLAEVPWRLAHFGDEILGVLKEAA
jgi:ribonuclease D